VRYWKPIQTGIETDDDTASVVALTGGDRAVALEEGIRLPRPLSPHLAAHLAGIRVSIDDMLLVARAQDPSTRWVVEGAGGVLVPINERELMIHLMECLALPIVVVARTALGTINHTLLTLEALRARSLTIAGVVMAGASHPDNRQAIAEYGAVTILGEVPVLEPLTADALKHAASLLDPHDALAAYLM
jgi:dethiobiotin synthase